MITTRSERVAITVRRATARDLATLVALERRCFAAPWSEASIADELARPIAVVDLAIAADGAVIGYAVAWRIGSECHLLRIATRPEARGRGVGARLLEAVIEGARGAGCEQVQLEVGRANDIAARLYGRAGFELVGVRAGYYRDPVDDALLMTRVLG
ncbi:MAG: ribosomal protein S18-alanine N-acetyltransferase [Nannocystaceae bacterium]